MLRKAPFLTRLPNSKKLINTICRTNLKMSLPTNQNYKVRRPNLFKNVFAQRTEKKVDYRELIEATSVSVEDIYDEESVDQKPYSNIKNLEGGGKSSFDHFSPIECIRKQEFIEQELIKNLRWDFVKLSRTAQNDLKKRLVERLKEFTNIKKPELLIKKVFDSEKMNVVLIKWKKKELESNSSHE